LYPLLKEKAAGASSGFHIGSGLLLSMWLTPACSLTLTTYYRDQINSTQKIFKSSDQYLSRIITDDLNARSVSIEDVYRPICL